MGIVPRNPIVPLGVGAFILQQSGKDALRYRHELRWCVVPAHRAKDAPDGTIVCSCQNKATCTAPGKHPFWPWRGIPGPLAPADMTEAWTRYPWANVAVLTGVRSGVIVADVDPRHGGSLEALWERGWPQETPTERTGGGGWHVYVACPDDGQASVDSYAPGIEVKADGKLVIAAPSRYHTGARYAWLDGLSPWDVPMAELPAEVLAGLHRPAKAEGVAGPAVSTEQLARRLPQAARLVDAAVERAHARLDGGRHQTLIWLANRLALLGLRGEALSSYLFDYQARVKGGWSV